MKNEQAKIKPYNRFSRPWWHSPSSSQFSSILSHFCALLGAVMIVVGCGQIKYVPVETTTQVEVKDSTVFHIKDSVRIIERSRWKDYGGLLDTLRIRGNRSEMRAWADTTNNIINGSLEEDPQEEKTRIIYKDRWKTRDSLVFKEVPVEVPVEKEVRIIPKFWRIMGILGIVCSTLVLAFAGLKIYGFFKFRKS